MPTPLPPTSDFTHADTTEGGFKVALANLRGFLASLLGTSGSTADARQALGVAGNEVIYKSEDYTLTASDCGKTFVWAGSTPRTASFDSAAELGNGWSAEFVNKMSVDLTLDPATVEAIDDSATLVLPAGGRAIVRCDGSGLIIVAKIDNSLVASFNTRTGAVTLTSGDVTAALGFTPATSTHTHSIYKLINSGPSGLGQPRHMRNIQSGVQHLSGASISGGNLRYAESGSGSAPGTWRCINAVAVNSNDVGYYERIS